MKLKIFSVFDSKVGAYLNPVFLRPAPEAVRSFQDAVNREDSQFKSHAEDYTMFEIGSWDDQTASIDLLPTPHPIAKAIELLARNEDPSQMRLVK